MKTYGPGRGPHGDPVKVVEDRSLEGGGRVGRSVQCDRSRNTTEQPVVRTADRIVVKHQYNATNRCGGGELTF